MDTQEDTAQEFTSIQVSEYIKFVCFDKISEKSYHTWVETEASKNLTWARDMLKTVQMCQEHIKNWCDCIDMVARRNTNGLSQFCTNLHCTYPMSKKLSTMVIQNCSITGQQKRPCFEVMLSKHNIKTQFVHHSLIESLQTIWSIRNIDNIVNYTISRFKIISNEDTLSAVCLSFENSPEYDRLTRYIFFIFNDIRRIFNEDNNFNYLNKKL